MEHQQKLDELHRQSLENAEAFIKTKGILSESDKEKVDKAKKEWQEAWTKFQEALLYLERIEI
jgi:hypothetical protein